MKVNVNIIKNVLRGFSNWKIQKFDIYHFHRFNRSSVKLARGKFLNILQRRG